MSDPTNAATTITLDAETQERIICRFLTLFREMRLLDRDSDAYDTAQAELLALDALIKQFPGAACKHCGQNMKTAATCRPVPFRTGSMPTRFGAEERFGSRIHQEATACHDCGVWIGGFHHPGCDVEECPDCRQQALTCRCTDETTEATEPEGMPNGCATSRGLLV